MHNHNNKTKVYDMKKKSKQNENAGLRGLT